MLQNGSPTGREHAHPRGEYLATARIPNIAAVHPPLLALPAALLVAPQVATKSNP